jgi:hypothetical protein
MEKTPAPAAAETAPGGQHTPSESVPPQPAEPLSSVKAPPLAGSIPYARVGEDGVEFAGPRRTPAELTAFGGPVRVVVFGPDADSVAASLEGSRNWQSMFATWQLLPVSSNQSWGAASTALVHDLMDQHALAILALDRDSAHLAEQLALKAFVPVVALADDRSLTTNNVPWIFRLPAATTAASALELLKAAERTSGTSPEKLRDVLASGSDFSGVSFLSTGEPRSQLPPPKVQ